MPTSIRRRPAHIAAALAVSLATLLLPPAEAEAEDIAPSRQSQVSAAASVEVPVAVLGALSEGGRFVVQSLVVSGTVAVVTVSAVGVVGASFVVTLAAGAVHALGLVVGGALDVVVVSGGWLLRSAGETLCFIADDRTHAHLRSREL